MRLCSVGAHLSAWGGTHACPFGTVGPPDRPFGLGRRSQSPSPPPGRFSRPAWPPRWHSVRAAGGPDPLRTRLDRRNNFPPRKKGGRGAIRVLLLFWGVRNPPGGTPGIKAVVPPTQATLRGKGLPRSAPAERAPKGCLWQAVSGAPAPPAPVLVRPALPALRGPYLAAPPPPSFYQGQE